MTGVRKKGPGRAYLHFWSSDYSLDSLWLVIRPHDEAGIGDRGHTRERELAFKKRLHVPSKCFLYFYMVT